MEGRTFLEDLTSNITDLDRVRLGMEGDSMDDDTGTVEDVAKYNKREFEKQFQKGPDWESECKTLEIKMEDAEFRHQSERAKLLGEFKKEREELKIEINSLLDKIASLKPDEDELDALKREHQKQLDALKQENHELREKVQKFEQLNVTLMQSMHELKNPPEHRIERHYNVTETPTAQYELQHTHLQGGLSKAVVVVFAIVSALGEISSSIPPHHHQLYTDFGTVNPQGADLERTEMIEAELTMRFSCLAVFQRCMEVYCTRHISRAQIDAISNALCDLKSDVISFYNKKGFGDVSSNWDQAHWDDAIHYVLCHMGFSASFVKLGPLRVPFHIHVMGDGFSKLLETCENPFLVIDGQASSTECPFFERADLASPAFVYVRIPPGVRCTTKAFAQTRDAVYKATSIVVTDQKADAEVTYILQIGFQNRVYKIKHPTSGREIFFGFGFGSGKFGFDELAFDENGVIEKTKQKPQSPLKGVAVVYTRGTEHAPCTKE